MGIYDQDVRFDFSFAKMKPIIFGVGILAAIFLLIFAIMSASEALKEKPLQISLERRTIKANEVTRLNVTVVNTANSDARDVIVEAIAADPRSVEISPLPLRANVIPFLPKNDRRKIEYQVNPKGTILPGTYNIRVSTTLGGQLPAAYSEIAVLEVVE